MGTYLYLVCEDHDPRLFSHDEVAQHVHERELDKVRRWVADREEIVRARKQEYLGYDDYFLNHAVTFFMQHTKCRISAEDEEGKRYKMMPDPPPTPRLRPGR